MEMTGLRALHAGMNRLAIDVQQFRFVAGVAEFDCLFSVRDAPFLLTLTSRGRAPRFFRFDILPGYWINTFLGSRYGDLLDLLYIDGRSGHAFRPNDFFQQLNNAVPSVAQPRAVPGTAEIARLRHDVEERDKPFFDRWEQRGAGPTERNKAKTLALLGPEARTFSVQVNKSSIWSATPTGREWR